MSLIDTLIIAAAFFVFTLFAHIVICRLCSSGNFILKGLALGFFCTAGLVIYMLYTGRFDITGPYIFLSAWLFYLMVMINLMNSVTLKMLGGLYSSPTGFLSVQDISNSFNAEDGFETRLAMLHTSKLIQQKGCTLMLTPKARFLLTIIHQVKSLLSVG
jgi:hypothetical protein